MKILLNIAISIFIVVAGIYIAKVLLDSAPKAKSQTPQKRATIVEVELFKPKNEPIVAFGDGRVKVDTQTSLSFDISGRVVEIKELLKGQKIKKGELLAKIECIDYEIVAKQKEAERERILSEYELELGEIEVAKRELALAQERIELDSDDLSDIDLTYILREHQLKRVSASLKSADAALKRARLDISRCELKAPSDGVVISRGASVGSRVGVGSEVFKIVSKDSFYITALLHQEFLTFLERGAKAFLGEEALEIVSISPLLDTKTNLVEIILRKNSGDYLFEGEFLNIKFVGEILENIISIPSHLLKESSSVWVERDGRLEREDVEIVYMNRERVFIESYKPLNIVKTNLGSLATNGMPLKVKSE